MNPITSTPRVATRSHRFLSHACNRFVLALVGASLLCGCKPGRPIALDATDDFPAKSGFVERQITVDDKKVKLWVFIPFAYRPDKPTPTILFLHGLFERGKNDSNVLAAGLGPVIAGQSDRWPFITIFPQSSGDWRGIGREHLAIAALDDVSRHFAVDPDRVILAGLSYGGLGVWEIGAAHPDRFSALVPISGFGSLDRAPALTAISVWAFASHDDIWVESNDSAAMCRRIQELGGHAKYTEFDGDIHDCWQRAVAETDLVPWMLAQTRNTGAADPIRSAQAAPAGAGLLRSWSEPPTTGPSSRP